MNIPGKKRKTLLYFFLKQAHILIFTVIVLFTPGACRKGTYLQDDILRNKESFFYIDVRNYPEDRKHLPVGIFDSGTGGLAVMNDILDFRGFTDSCGFKFNSADFPRVFQNESFIYLADMANMPYGSYALENNSELLVEHVLKDVQFLIGNKYYRTVDSDKYMSDKCPVKVIIIACNTATAYGLEMIREFMKKAQLDIGVIGVIDAGAVGALRNFSFDENGSIAILATDGTVKSGAYVNTIETWIKEYGLEGDIRIYQQAGIGIAEAIDENRDFIDRYATRPRNDYKGQSESGDGEMYIDFSLWDRYAFNTSDGAMLCDGKELNEYQNVQINSVENYISFHIISLLEKIKITEGTPPLKSVVLGCTHYPFYEDVFKKTLSRLRDYKEGGEFVYRPFIAENIVFVNPGVLVAGQLYDYLNNKNMLNECEESKSEFYISVPNVLNKQVSLREDGSFTYEYKYGRRPGDIQEYVKITPFSYSSVSKEILDRLSKQIPLVYEFMVSFNNENSKTNFLREEEKIKTKKQDSLN